MPHTGDGRRVDILLNLLAIINRTTSFPLYELILTSITYQIRQKMKTMESEVEQEELFFKFLKIFNEDEYKKIWSLYEQDTDKGRHEFLQDIIYDGIYLHQPPMWEKRPIFYRIMDILDAFPWLKPDDVYIKKWGRVIKTLSTNWIGDIYILKLKQSDRRGFSVRSTGAIDIKGLPTRSYKSRSHLEQTSGTAIRFGEYETLREIRRVA